MHLEMLCPIAGGGWNDGSAAGVWAVYWNNARGNSNDNVGFRAAAKRSDLQAAVSSLGHARKTASHNHMVHHLKEHHHALYLQLPKSHRRDHHLPDATP